MSPPLLTRLLLLLIQFTILAFAFPNLSSKPTDQTLLDTAADIVDSLLDPPSDTTPGAETETQCIAVTEEHCVAEDGVVVRQEGPGKVEEREEGGGKVEKRKRPPMLRRSSSWANSREKIEFVGVLGSGRWLGG